MRVRTATMGVIATLAALLVVAVAAAERTTHSAARDSTSLVIAGYGGLEQQNMTQYVFNDFTKDTGIHVTWLTVPGQQVAGVTAQNQAGSIQWDMTLKLADSDMATLWKAGYLATMPASLFKTVSGVIPGTQTFAIPDQQGAVMVACNYKLVSPCPKTPKQFFDTKTYPGPRMLPSFQPLVAIGLALEASGLKPADVFPASEKQSMANVKKAESMLNALKPSIKTFYSNSSDALQLFQSGEVTIAGLWNFVAARGNAAPTSNMSLGASWTGAVVYPQYTVVYKGAPDEANAWTLVKWMATHPKNMAAYADADGAGLTDVHAFTLTSAKSRQWQPTAAHKQQTVTESVLWYVKYPKVKAEIDNFWKGYTSG